jgi:prephenate dehydrogenase
MTFRRLSIIGVGLLGGSIGLSLRSKLKSCKIMGYGHNQATLDRAMALGAIDEATTDLNKAVEGADLVILCTPVGVLPAVLKKIAPILTSGTVVTDVGSTKRTVCTLADELMHGRVHFVGSHPMAGSEKRGIDAARSDLYGGALCIVTPTAKTDPASVEVIESFWRELGMRITRLTPEEHDRLLASVSHLPHALAASLVMMQADESLLLAGKGFLDSTRIAAGDAGLWRDIFLDNADNVRQSIQLLRQQLDNFEKLLAPTMSERLRKWLEDAASRRKRDQLQSGGAE